MKHLGNIVFDNCSDNTGLYNICDMNNLEPGIPTLIVGWENVKKLYPQQSIINWKINENTYWTFGKREKRDKYEANMSLFMSLCLKKIKKNVEYVFFDMFLCDDECKLELKNLITGKNSKTCFINNGMAYIYSSSDDIVYGIRLNDIDYEGKNSAALLAMIKNNPAIRVINNINFVTRSLFTNNQYIIPYIYS